MICAENCEVNLERYKKRKLSHLAAEEFASSVKVSKHQATEKAKTRYSEQYGPDAALEVPDISVSASGLYRARQAKFPPPPHTYNEIPNEFPIEYATIQMGNRPVERFLYVNNAFPHPHDDLPDQQRILGFSTHNDLIQLGRAHKVCIDGTFKSTPPPFAQVVTLNTFIGPSIERSALTPRAYFLLPGKGAAVYLALLEITLELIESENEMEGFNNTSANWSSIVADFEGGIRAAVLNEEFDPNGSITLECCWYHYCAAVLRWLWEEAGLAVPYKLPGSALRSFVKLLFALPFAKIEDIPQAYADIVQNNMPEEFQLDPRFDRFLDYYYNTWVINIPNRIVSNVSERRDRRTNNDLEGFHHKMNLSITSHASLWVFIEELKKLHAECKSFEAAVLNNPFGATKLRAADVRAKDAHIAAMYEMYNNYPSVAHYVRAVAQHL